MSPYAVWYTVKKYARLAGVKDVTLHTFRHSVATQLVRDPEIDLVTAATFLGHSRLDTTAQYSRPGEEDFKGSGKDRVTESFLDHANIKTTSRYPHPDAARVRRWRKDCEADIGCHCSKLKTRHDSLAVPIEAT